MSRLSFWLLGGVIGLILFSIAPDIAYAQCAANNGVHNLAQALNESCGVSWSAWVFQIWRLMMTVVNVFVVLFIIFIALSTILHWNVDTYGFKKALPTLIIAVVLANFSLLIVRGMVDLASILILAFAGDTRTLAEGIARAIFGTLTAPISGIIGYPIVQWLFLVPALGLGILLMVLGGILVVLLPAIGFLILWFLLLIRLSIVLVFAAVSPLAFMALALPGTRQWFSRWFGIMLNWVFMAPVVFLLLRIGGAVGDLANRGVSTDVGFVNTMIPFVIALGALFMAIMAPFKMGGAIAAMGGAFMGFVAGTRAGGYLRRPYEAFVENVKAKQELRYQKGPFGQLESRLKTTTEVINKETEARKALTARLLRERRPDFAAREDRAEFEKRELERVKEQALTNIDFNNPGYARTKRATEQAINLAKLAREKYSGDIDMEEYARRFPAVDAQINALAPGDPMRRRLEYERSRMMRLVDEEQKTSARAIAEDATPELQLGRFQRLLDNPGTTEQLSFGAWEGNVSGDDLRNFSQRNFAALDPDQEIASLKAQAIEQQMSLTMREWLRKGPNDPQFYDGVERATDIAQRLFTTVPSGARAGQPWLLTTFTQAQLAAMPPNERRQLYVEASRELQQTEFAPPTGVPGPSGTLGMGRRPSTYHP